MEGIGTGRGRGENDGLGTSGNDTFVQMRASADRFIPVRTPGLHLSLLDTSISEASPTPPQAGDKEDGAAYGNLLRAELLGMRASAHSPASTSMTPGSPGARSSPKVLQFRSGDTPRSRLGAEAPTSPFSLSPVGSEISSRSAASPKPQRRKISRQPFKVLDAPSLQNDFYLNLVHWSSQNIISVGLGPCVYLYNACDSRVTKLCDLAPSGTSVASVSWTQRGTYLAVGTDSGEVQIWDPERAGLTPLRTMAGHDGRVGCLSWSSHILASGSRDRSILLRDVRAPEPFVAKLSGHRSEVCGLQWGAGDREVASGGNDNVVNIWNVSSTDRPVHQFTEHTAAVKAIAWSPHQHGLLASGGGTNDRCIRFWNTTTGTCLGCVDTGSQVCNLGWAKTVNEIVSTHGFSQNQVTIWRYPTMSKLATLTAHEMRVLYLAMSPDGQTIVTGAGDETLRFWKVFPGQRSLTSPTESGLSTMNRAHIR